MRFLIDGYNLLHTHFQNRINRNGLEAERVLFLRSLAPFARSVHPKRLEIVFDAPQKSVSNDFKPISVVFASPKADDYIIKKVDKGGHFIVVTDDWEIREAAKDNNCEVIDSTEFLLQAGLIEVGQTSRENDAVVSACGGKFW